MTVDKIDNTKELRQIDEIAETAAIIRQESKAGRLIEEAVIMQRPAGQDNFSQSAEPEIILKKTIDENEDIHKLVAENGSSYYFSTRFMTEVYADILLKKQGDSLKLIADFVRQTAADYLRPVPLDTFLQSPFDFTYDEILKIVEKMENMSAFQDIKRTATSTSREFLYSANTLEPLHASMQAEWIDVGQSENP